MQDFLQPLVYAYGPSLRVPELGAKIAKLASQRGHGCYGLVEDFGMGH